MPSVPEPAVALAKRFEGLKDGDLTKPGLQPYICPAGVPTIGWGSTRYRDGRPVNLEDPGIAEAEAEELLDEELDRCADAVLRLIRPRLSDGQMTALIDFAYNLGTGALKASTLRARVNREDPEAHVEFHKWVFAGGRKLPGLVIRRAAEAALFRNQ